MVFTTKVGRTAFELLIWLPTGFDRAATAVEWGLKRLQKSAPFAKRRYIQRAYKGSLKSMFTFQSWKELRFISLTYRYIARNCIKVRCVTSTPVTFTELKHAIKDEIPGPYIRAITEETPMVMF